MKLIVAIVRPFMMDKIIAALEDVDGFPGMTVTDSEGFGQRLRSTAYDAITPFKPNKRIEIAAEDVAVEPIVAAIKTAARTGKKGDGVIYVVSLEGATLI